MSGAPGRCRAGGGADVGDRRERTSCQQSSVCHQAIRSGVSWLLPGEVPHEQRREHAGFVALWVVVFRYHGYGDYPALLSLSGLTLALVAAVPTCVGYARRRRDDKEAA